MWEATYHCPYTTDTTKQHQVKTPKDARSGCHVHADAHRCPPGRQPAANMRNLALRPDWPAVHVCPPFSAREAVSSCAHVHIPALAEFRGHQSPRQGYWGTAGRRAAEVLARLKRTKCRLWLVLPGGNSDSHVPFLPALLSKPRPPTIYDALVMS